MFWAALDLDRRKPTFNNRAVPKTGRLRCRWQPNAPAKPLKEGFDMSTFSPYLLGFDHLERLLERTAKSASDVYPPYNIEQTGPERLRIVLAVAGFSRDDLNVT